MVNIRTGSVVLMLLALAACSGHDPVSKCKGPVFQLNTGHWKAQPADLTKQERVSR